MTEQAVKLNYEDRLALEALLNGISYAIDHLEISNLTQFLTPDAVFDLGGHRLEGSATIVATLEERGQQRQEVTRHIWSNLSFTSVTDAEIRTSAVMIVLSAVTEDGQTTKSFRGGDIHDVIVRTPDGFRLKSRTMIVALPF